MTASEQLIATAREWVGVPWVHQGRSRDGVDCIGLLIVVCLPLGLMSAGERWTQYRRTPSGRELVAVLDARLERSSSMEPGCVMLIRGAVEPQHVAFCAGESMIHAWARAPRRPRVVQHRIDAAWRRLTVGTYRIPGVAYG
jgi:hypothetical protein